MYDFLNYHEAYSLQEAKKLLQEHDPSKIIAGGTDLLIKIRKNGAQDVELIGINRIEELKKISIDKEQNLKIGALAVFSRIENNEIIKKYARILSKAASAVGGPQIRNLATIGGNICNGAVSADSAPSLFTMNAKLKLESLTSSRIVDIQNFYLGPGKTDLKQNEILTHIIISPENYLEMRGEYIKFSMRNAMDIATLGCAVLCKLGRDNNRINDVRIALGVAGPVPIRCSRAEEFLSGKKLTSQILDKTGDLALRDAMPRDSWRASKAYREQLIRVLTKKALQSAVGE